MARQNIETWTDYDRQGIWTLHLKKKRGKFTLDEIIEACKEYDQDFYMLAISAFDRDGDQYYEFEDLTGDNVTLYRAEDFFEWREKHNG